MKSHACLLALVALCASVSVRGDPRERATYRAQNGSVTVGHARMEFLSPTMVRLQFSSRSHFVDQPTVVVKSRQRFPVRTTISGENGWVIISTPCLTIRYRTGTGSFTGGNLTVSWNFKGFRGAWAPGDVDTLNLGGIVTLDGVNGRRLPPPQTGLLSRSGYFILDDSQSPIMDPKSNWVVPRMDEGDQDWYFIVYGHEYRHALKEFALLCGRIPMVPRYSLGVWMTDLNFEYLPGSDITTRYHLTSEEVKQEVNRFRAEGLPLDVLVLDFGWHKFGWQGGYDWSPLFADPDGFLRWCHESGLHVSVNDHPKMQGETALSNQDSHAREARRLLGRRPAGRSTFSFESPGEWRFRTDPTDTGMIASWYSTNYPDSSWEYLDGGKPWQEQGHPDYIGFGWYRKWIELPEKGAQRLYLVLGGAADQYELFVNGKKVGEHISAGNRVYNTMTYTDVTDFLERGRRNLFALRINDWSGYGGLTALPVEIRDAVPPGLLEFTLTDKRDAHAFMSALHAPLMKEGVDFWWIDGSGPCPVKGLNGQLWTNKLYYDFTQAFTGKRSLIISRYAGWGSQRYPAFITGDTYSEWPMLRYQVGFTGRAGNVLMPYITHDIGGFHGDTLSVGLYCRWLEFGAFSPMLRLHCAHENPTSGNLRMPWIYGKTGIDVARTYFNLREQLLPYIYTYARLAYDDALPLVRPLYLEEPEMPEAYAYPGEYFFGDDFLVSPVADSNDVATTFFPPGKWIRYSDGKEYGGGQEVSEKYATDAIPLFVKAGSIIPMQPRMRYCSERPLDTLMIQVFGPDPASFNLYEDDGISLQYLRGRCSWTGISSSGNGQTGYHVKIGATSGSYSGQASRRAYILQLHGYPEPHEILVDGRILNQEERTGTWHRDPQTGTVEISIPARDIRDKVETLVR